MSIIKTPAATDGSVFTYASASSFVLQSRMNKPRQVKSFFPNGPAAFKIPSLCNRPILAKCPAKILFRSAVSVISLSFGPVLSITSQNCLMFGSAFLLAESFWLYNERVKANRAIVKRKIFFISGLINTGFVFSFLLPAKYL